MSQKNNRVKQVRRIRKKTILAFCIVMALQLFPTDGAEVEKSNLMANPKSESLRNILFLTPGKQGISPLTSTQKPKENKFRKSGTGTGTKFPRNLIKHEKFIRQAMQQNSGERSMGTGNSSEVNKGAGIPAKHRLSPTAEFALVALILGFVITIIILIISVTNCKLPFYMTRRFSTAEVPAEERTELTSNSTTGYQHLLTPGYNSVGTPGNRVVVRPRVTVEDHTQEPPVTTPLIPERILNALTGESLNAIPLFPVCPPRKKQDNAVGDDAEN